MNIVYKAEPTLSQFHQCDADVRGIMGPIGSGKSVACCIEILTRARRQAPNKDGIRKSRWAVIRNTYPELKSTTINTWKEWIPEEICPITYGSPIEGCLRTPLDDGTQLDLHIYFLSLDKPKDVRKLLSLELTGVWVNEAREIAWSIVQAALSRTGRYPAKRDAEITWTGMILDTNPPDDDHWWYRQAEEIKPHGWVFFRQPGALLPVLDPQGRILSYKANPAAENVQHQPLGYQYWMRLTQGTDPQWIRVHCCGEYGSVFDGKPVYHGIYNDTVHTSPTPLGLYRGRPIHLGFDFGLTPACIIGQIAPNGQLRILRELICQRGGIKQFVTDTVTPMLNTLFPSLPVISTGDPAGAQASQADELTCLRQLQLLGIPTHPAPTNTFLARRQAVLDRLTRTQDGHPALLLDPSCKMLRKGFIGGYKFERVQITGEERYKEQPAKNKYSHPHDALQYLILGCDTIDAPSTPVPPISAPNWAGIL